LEERHRKASFFNGSHYGGSFLSEPNTGYIIMHDLNTKEKTKRETLIFNLVTLL